MARGRALAGLAASVVVALAGSALATPIPSVVHGADGDDVLRAPSTAGAELFGHRGADRLIGGPGPDTEHGGAGADTLDGGRGADLLDGDRGDDVLTGGPGRDRFILRPGGGHDQVTDFTPGVDEIFVEGASAPRVAAVPGGAAVRLDDGSELRLTGVMRDQAAAGLVTPLAATLQAQDAPLASLLALAPLALSAAWLVFALKRRRDKGGADLVAAPAALSMAPVLFAMVGLASSLTLAISIPAYMAADEKSHLGRAYLLSRGELFGARRVSGDAIDAGGPIDPALIRASKPYDPVIFHPEVKVTPRMAADAQSVGWSGDRAFHAFPGSAAYPPFLYAPASLGLALGERLHLSVVSSVHLARAMGALACVLLGGLALSFAGRARPVLFTLMLLPMSAALFGAAGQDGPLIAIVAVASGLIARAAKSGRPMTRLEIYLAAAAFALAGMAKPPYALLSLVLPACAGPKRHLWAASLMALACGLGWNLYAQAMIASPLGRPDVALDPAGQVAFLLAHPLAVGDIAAHTLTSASMYASGFVGVFGWLDTWLPQPYYLAAGAALVVAVIAAGFGRAASGWTALRPATALVCLFATAAIFVAMDVMWTPVGARVIDGVQGRYFLPIAALLALMIEAPAAPRPSAAPAAQLRRAAEFAVLAFPIVSLIVAESAVLARYYP